MQKCLYCAISSEDIKKVLIESDLPLYKYKTTISCLVH